MAGPLGDRHNGTDVAWRPLHDLVVTGVELPHIPSRIDGHVDRLRVHRCVRPRAVAACRLVGAVGAELPQRSKVFPITCEENTSLRVDGQSRCHVDVSYVGADRPRVQKRSVRAKALDPAVAAVEHVHRSCAVDCQVVRTVEFTGPVAGGDVRVAVVPPFPCEDACRCEPLDRVVGIVGHVNVAKGIGGNTRGLGEPAPLSDVVAVRVELLDAAIASVRNVNVTV